MMLLRYPFPSLAVVSIVLVLATIAVPLFAFLWLVVILAAALAVVVTLACALVAASRPVGRRLGRWLNAATRQGVGTSVARQQHCVSQPTRSPSASSAEAPSQESVTRGPRR